MTAIRASKTISVCINRTPQYVYKYTSNPENMPKWATQFCRSIRQAEDHWIIETPVGPMTVRFVELNTFGVLDHYVKPTPDTEVYAPMRVLANGPESEVIFTVFRQPEMTDEQFMEDTGMVQKDLDSLKAILEA